MLLLDKRNFIYSDFNTCWIMECVKQKFKLNHNPNILNKLPEKIKNRLKTTTMLDAMTHMSGIKNYLDKYFDALEINNKICPKNI